MTHVLKWPPPPPPCSAATYACVHQDRAMSPVNRYRCSQIGVSLTIFPGVSLSSFNARSNRCQDGLISTVFVKMGDPLYRCKRYRHDIYSLFAIQTRSLPSQRCLTLPAAISLRLEVDPVDGTGLVRVSLLCIIAGQTWQFCRNCAQNLSREVREGPGCRSVQVHILERQRHGRERARARARIFISPARIWRQSYFLCLLRARFSACARACNGQRRARRPIKRGEREKKAIGGEKEQ